MLRIRFSNVGNEQNNKLTVFKKLCDTSMKNPQLQGSWSKKKLSQSSERGEHTSQRKNMSQWLNKALMPTKSPSILDTGRNVVWEPRKEPWY